MFWTRLLSGIILLIIALTTVISGGDVLFVTIALVSLIGLYELYKVVKIQNTMLGFAGYLVSLIYFLFLRINVSYDWEMLFVVAFLVIIMTVYVVMFPKYKTEQVIFAFFGFFYVSVMLSYIYQTRMLPTGALAVWLIFICSWGADTCAYCVGMLIGKHKMTPNLSPKKSIEGAIGGIIGAGILGAIYALVVGAEMIPYGIICSAGSVIAIIGDLAASAIKRNHDIKDYGKLIPGHGGILDRFDSVIFTAPIIYFLAMVIL